VVLALKYRGMAKAKKKTSRKPAKPAKKASRKIDPLNRKNYTALTPVLTVRDIRAAAGFYKKVLGFTVTNMIDSPNGPVHAELRLRDTTLMLSPESPERKNFTANSIGRTPVTLYVLVENVDAVFKRAVAAGAKVAMPVANMFWGDRAGMIADLDGNQWMLATHKAEPTEAQMREAMQREMAQAAAQAREGAAAAAAAAGSESEY
jgi:PhnB protein